MTETRDKIYFASDVHLGHPPKDRARERERLFVKWLDSIKHDAAGLYLCGDIFDFWFEYKSVVPRGFVRTLGKLAELSDSGVDIHFFIGNHDVWMFDYFEEELGATVHIKPYETELLGKKFYMHHGDGLGKGDKPYKMMKWCFMNKTMQWMFKQLHPNFSFGVAHWVSKSGRDAKGIVAEEFNKSGNEYIYNHAVDVASKQNVDYFVFGHRHVMINQEINNGSTLCILGDWLYNFSYGVFDGEKFELKKISVEAE